MKDFVQQHVVSGRYVASANTAHAIAREIRALVDHPQPHVTDRPLIVAAGKRQEPPR